ncbi:hypothetical protein LTR36_008344 [Oleoguttula mirabilis]|uniref:Major facilitator superfamily (MFS) profile domain-containing protein n=1 Tax=Oleoguttula mirabilis TaxID=1507867 RepID=A0AAV9J8M3_9PEZI|nr:hypothetical protein LTR36_008344 [Oleoguttula mirabilis]
MAPAHIAYKTSPQPKANNPSNLAPEKALPTPTDVSAAPDGGARPWLVAAGAFCIAFCALGFTNATGVLQQYYLTHQLRHKSTDAIAWIGSLASFLQFVTGAFTGPPFDRYGAWIIRPATLLYVLAVMLTSLCHEHWHFLLVQGVLMGTCMGFMQFPALAAVSQYFDANRAAALGVAISGSSVGGVVMPIALSHMLNSSTLGFGWSVRIIGLLMIPLMAFACVAVTPRLPARQRTTFFIAAAWHDPRYGLLVAATFFMLFGMFTPLFFLPTYAVSRGMPATLASYLLAVVNAASTFGRIIPGILADRFGRLNIFALGGIATGIVLLCFNEAESTAALVVYSIIVGFASGTILSGATAAFSVCPKDARDIGTYLGMGLCVGSVAALCGPPINGALVDRYGGFLEVGMFGGGMCLLGGFLALASKVATPQGVLGRV